VPNLETQLLGSRKFKAATLAELQTEGKLVPLTPFVRIYIERLGRVHEALRSKTAAAVQQCEAVLVNATSRAESALPGDRRGLLLAIEESAEGDVVGEVYVNNDKTVERRESLTRKNRRLDGLSTRYVTGRVEEGGFERKRTMGAERESPKPKRDVHHAEPGSRRLARPTDEEDGANNFPTYLEYNRILRTWFVAFGIGGPALFLANASIAVRLSDTGNLQCVASLFLVGALAQVLGALTNKFANWIIYYGEADQAFQASQRYRLALWVSQQFWIDIALDLLTVVTFAWAVWLMLTVFSTSPGQSPAATGWLC
jgi:hypothetical protein